MKQFTIRGVPSEIEQMIEEESKARGISLNKAFLDRLQRVCSKPQSRPAGEKRALPPDMEKMFGTWSEEEAREFENNLRSQRTLDKELWIPTD